MNKKVILNVQQVYTANAFGMGTQEYIAAGSETTPAVYLYDLHTQNIRLVANCPGGVMSFVPAPSFANQYYSVMALFPGFVGAKAGIFRHVFEGGEWATSKVLPLPFAHRCDVMHNEGKDYLFAASVSQFKDNPADWSRTGEIFCAPLDAQGLAAEPEKVFTLYRNHGMLKKVWNGVETLMVSGAEGIYALELHKGQCVVKPVFDKEVSEFGFVDFNGDGKDELVTIEPFHGNKLNVYRQTAAGWECVYTDGLEFGHGLSCGIFHKEPVMVVGNRRGPLTLSMYKAQDLAAGKFSRQTLEEEAGPTQTQVFTAADGTDYILSANQLKNEVALYW